MKKELLRLDRITINREGVPLLNSLVMRIFEGEILGLIPVNVQGLEELIEVIRRNRSIHYGYVRFSYKLVNDYRNSRITANPVYVIGDRTSLIDSMSVAENVFVVRGNTKQYFIKRKILNDQFLRIAEELNLNIYPDAPVDALSFFEKRAVELVKAVVSGAQLIIFRDISNSAGPSDLPKIQRLIRHYARRGVTSLYICNHHQEVFGFCDRCVLLENGAIIKNLYRDQMNEKIITRFPQGFFRDLSLREFETSAVGKSDVKPVFYTENLKEQSIDGVSISLEPGECAVIMDLDNFLYTPMASLFRNRRNPEGGSIKIAGADINQAGRQLAFLDLRPIDTALFHHLSYMDNLWFLADRRIPLFWFHRRFRKNSQREYQRQFGQVVYQRNLANLSTKQLYDLIYHRILLQRPALLVCIQPFAEVDMHQRLRIIELMKMLGQRGTALLILAVSLSDSLLIADRLILAKEGKVVRQISKKEFSFIDPNQFSKE